MSREAVLKVSFSDLLLHRSRKYIDLATLPEMVAVVSLILAVDAERIFRRAIDRDMAAKVTIQISAGDLPEDIVHYFVGGIEENFLKRTVVIEPAGVPSSVNIELN